ncbi:hypothetical protein EGJ15_19840 [Pseudomonas sp. p99-361]|nr:hypothetical protein EGJ15_19840 [Pseudomonas sp. p99-361]
MQLAACSLQLAACSLQLAASSLQLAACSFQLPACSCFHRVPFARGLWYNMRRFRARPRQHLTHTRVDTMTWVPRVAEFAGWSLGYVEAQPDLSRNYHVPSQYARYAEGRCALRPPDPLLEPENGQVHFRRA